MGMPIANDAYMKAYMDGYSAALERNNIKAIRHKCNGGLLQTEGKVLNSEVRYWEANPDTKFIERL